VYLRDRNNVSKFLNDDTSNFIKEKIINIHIGDAPKLLQLTGPELMSLMDMIYPTVNSFNRNRNGKYTTPTMGYYGKYEAFRNCFRLKYSDQEIYDIYKQFKETNNSNIINAWDQYIKNLCCWYNRNELYKRVTGNDININSMYNQCLANYLIYNPNIIENININPELIYNSDNPNLLFSKYKEKFLGNANIRDGFNGILYPNQYIIYNILGYKLNPNNNMDALPIDSVSAINITLENLNLMKNIEYITLYNAMHTLHPYYLYQTLDYMLHNNLNKYIDIVDQLLKSSYSDYLENFIYITSAIYPRIVILLHKFINKIGNDDDIILLKNILNGI
ncbi:Hypothetical protein ORPV_65, partial [Orpheovirus IHUMI-LCC2]